MDCHKFYKATFDKVGPPLLEAFNAMLAEVLLPVSMCQGVVPLLPKVAGLPAASQLWPITLPVTDYKLLTKILLACLILILPTVFPSTQIGSVRGCSILMYR